MNVMQLFILAVIFLVALTLGFLIGSDKILPDTPRALLIIFPLFVIVAYLSMIVLPAIVPDYPALFPETIMTGFGVLLGDLHNKREHKRQPA